ncbi:MULTISPECIES: biliverdin-producing heme oxygenase [Microcella]|uniref:biliverdin-producing heme oxygenase n=1 Tax=Microcella TaxID=337004 RepID=UPI0015CF71DD|nr:MULTISPECIES: biliverdin-producing heme oxygenase [Microcella]QOD93982.1 biliverdin-producing heme oxygenase [Chryseoglobus sp. 28M-23]
MTAPEPDVIPFSRLVRERTARGHSSSESATFMSDLMAGAGSREDYVALVEQHYVIYEALESVQPAMRENPDVAPFLSPALTRLPALENDLAFLHGGDWRARIAPLEITRRYAARILEVAATWPAGYVAHHYTRYLGDLSGGQYIAKVMARRFGFETNGIGFYLFDQIADPGAFKDTYRHQLDTVAWNDDERERVIDEVMVAYDFNTQLFVGLAEARDAA